MFWTEKTQAAKRNSNSIGGRVWIPVGTTLYEIIKPADPKIRTDNFFNSCICLECWVCMYFVNPSFFFFKYV